MYTLIHEDCLSVPELYRHKMFPTKIQETEPEEMRSLLTIILLIKNKDYLQHFSSYIFFPSFIIIQCTKPNKPQNKQHISIPLSYDDFGILAPKAIVFNDLIYL